MRRRELLLLVAVTITAALAGHAQQPMSVIGYLSVGSLESDNIPRRLVSFRRGLEEAGYVEGRNVAIEYRWAEGKYDRVPRLAADLAGRNVAVIVATNINAAFAAKAATSTIPIVFLVGIDPVASGLVDRLSHPGGNLTGVSIVFGDLWPKRLELLHELLPKAGVISVLINPTNRNADFNMQSLRLAAHAIGLRLEELRASNESEIDAAFGTLERSQSEALFVGDDPFFVDRATQLTALATRWRIPAIYQNRVFADAGGLISYGPDLSYFRVVGEYTGRILKGTKPGDLPVQQPTTFELVVNLKTAQALGLTVPPSILARADEVIE
jgi:putative tryptophan/tyrosine transport system substrate-binding protein